MSLIEMSLSGGIMIFVSALLRAATINRLPKRMFLVLWGVVLLRLFIPLNLPSPLSVYNYGPVRPETVRTLVPSVMGTAGAQTTQHSFPVFLIIWIAGALVCTGYFVVTYLRCRREFAMSLPVNEIAVTSLCYPKGIKRLVSIRQSDRISAPLTYGVLHPVILMPKNTNWNDQKLLCYVLAHETIHIRRLDAVAKFVLTAAVCVHWFNPLVWIMYTLANRDLELSCDEAVVRQFGDETKTDYARVLIQMEENKSGWTPLYNGLSSHATEERIRAIMKMKKMSRWTTAAAVAVILVITGVFATSCTQQTTADPIDTLKNSVVFQDDSLRFTVPKGYDGKWNIHISGRVDAGGMGMSVHYLEDENENGQWTGGHTYSIDVSGGGYTELLMTVAVGDDSKGTDIDLMSYLSQQLRAE